MGAPLRRLLRRLRSDRLIIELSEQDSERLREIIGAEAGQLEKRRKRSALVFWSFVLLTVVAVLVTLFIWRLSL